MKKVHYKKKAMVRHTEIFESIEDAIAFLDATASEQGAIATELTNAAKQEFRDHGIRVFRIPMFLAAIIPFEGKTECKLVLATRFLIKGTTLTGITTEPTYKEPHRFYIDITTGDEQTKEK